LKKRSKKLLLLVLLARPENKPIRWRSNGAVTVLSIQPRVIVTIPARIGTQGFDIYLAFQKS
jgi:hypothetical protein